MELSLVGKLGCNEAMETGIKQGLPGALCEVSQRTERPARVNTVRCGFAGAGWDGGWCTTTTPSERREAVQDGLDQYWSVAGRLKDVASRHSVPVLGLQKP
ncbi:hypothetical protein CBL_04084 [Carabus blaptoides fortunei]